MNADDHALVVGIRRYADVPAGWITDLKGPTNDAKAIAAWLEKPDGGDLPKRNIRVVCSPPANKPFPAGGPTPAQKEIEEKLGELAALPPNGFKSQEGEYAGRRLYVYVSGHGIAADIDEAALITAEAKKAEPSNVQVTSWIDWLFKAASFQELVLWVDCCATGVPEGIPIRCALPRRVGNNASRRFIAYATRFNKQAVENRMDDRKWHGAFTYALLRGLEGAATGGTSDSLKNYLINNMKDFQRPDQQVGAIDNEPSFGTTDPMSFGTPKTPLKFDVTLNFPQSCVGNHATVGVNASSPAVASTELKQGKWKVPLEAGIYVACVPALAIVQPFQVNGDELNAEITIP